MSTLQSRSELTDPSVRVSGLLMPADRPLPPARRLVALVPAVEEADGELAKQLWSLASPRALDVLLVGLCSQPDDEMRVRRHLATLAALTRDERLHVDTCLGLGRDWLDVVHAVGRPGDLVVCHAEQRARHGLALGQAVVRELGMPVYIFVGVYPKSLPARSRAQAWLMQSIPALIVAVFTAAQIVIQRFLATARPYTLLMTLSVVAEYGLIALWFHLSNSQAK
ncbi:MAG: hypothetical protein HY872_17735 [Chloroflexi bacterium]|nr:hypothetical protein [Chloroflexota bacterium]MBI5830052.1 hypothetical protein [Chloroflexota bacterium]